MNKLISVFIFCMLLTNCASTSDIEIRDTSKLLKETQKFARTTSGLTISPDIKANNLDGPVNHNQAENLSVTVSLGANGSSEDSDWWIVAASPFGWFYFDAAAMKWVHAGESYTNLSYTYQGPLFDLSPFEVLNLPGLPEGNYILYFGVDTNMNGSLDFDQLFFDYVMVNINVDGKEKINVPFGTLGEGVSVKAGQPKTISMVSELSPGAGPFTDISIDLNKALANVTVDLGSSVAAQLKDNSNSEGNPSPAQVSVRIESASNIDTVCETGFLIGTYAVAVDSSNQPSSVTPATASVPQSTLSVVNSGPFAICTEITYPVDASFNLDSIDLDTTVCNETPADISGTWVGTFSCSNVGCPDDGGAISMTVTQNNNSAHYVDDGGASYDGSVCGNVYKFNGGIFSSYTEHGTFVLNEDGSASKTSSWIGSDGYCRGDCVDNLHRQ